MLLVAVWTVDNYCLQLSQNFVMKVDLKTVAGQLKATYVDCLLESELCDEESGAFRRFTNSKFSQSCPKLPSTKLI